MDAIFFENLTPLDWGLLVLSGLIVGFAKTGIAGIGILAVPIFADIFPPKDSAGVLLPLLCVADVIAVAYYRRHADWKKIIGLMPWVAIGLLIGTFIYFFGNKEGTFLFKVVNEYMKPIIGILVLLVLVISIWREKSPELPEGKLLAATTGIAAGLTTMLANAAGPIMNVYLLMMKLPKEVFIGTAAWFFLIVNFVKLPFMTIGAGSITKESPYLNGMLIPAVLLGGILGVKVVKFIPEEKFKKFVQVLILLTSIKLILW